VYWLTNAGFLLSFALLVLGWGTEFVIRAAYASLAGGAFFSLFIYTRWRRDGPDDAFLWLHGMYVMSAFFHALLWVALGIEWYRIGTSISAI
jgi:hypothetical protein